MWFNQIKKPVTSWLEDKDGNKLPDREPGEKLGEGEYQHYNFVESHERIYTKKPKYSKFKRWVADILGLSYRNDGLLIEFTTGGNAITPVVRELLNRRWSLSDAVFVAYEMCEGCLNTILSGMEGWGYTENPRTRCKHYKIIRPEVSNEDLQKLSWG